MTQRLTIASGGYKMEANDHGAYVYHQCHKEVVELLTAQLNATQKLLDEERQYSKHLVERIMER